MKRASMRPTVLIAIGGNSLLPAGETATLATERRHAAATCREVVEVVAHGWQVVLTHGNGPQVGAALRRSERGTVDVYELPLAACVASTQGEIGWLLLQALHEALSARGMHRAVAAVLAQVVVNPEDPAFADPRKPIGVHGSRRLVASPEPCAIVEEPVIRTLVRSNAIVITLGGGGIPVVRRGHRLEGIDAVVDKDLASALLAIELDADVLLMATDVDAVQLDYGTPDARALRAVTVDELRGHAAAGQFPPGSMGPKVEAALRFVEAGGREAIVTSPGQMMAALAGRAGTHVELGARRWIAFAR